MVTHVRMRTLPSSPATPPPRYRVISEFDAAGSFGVDPVTGEVFIATKLDFDNRYVNCHTDNGPPDQKWQCVLLFSIPGIHYWRPYCCDRISPRQEIVPSRKTFTIGEGISLALP